MSLIRIFTIILAGSVCYTNADSLYCVNVNNITGDAIVERCDTTDYECTDRGCERKGYAWWTWVVLALIFGLLALTAYCCCWCKNKRFHSQVSTIVIVAQPASSLDHGSRSEPPPSYERLFAAQHPLEHQPHAVYVGNENPCAVSEQFNYFPLTNDVSLQEPMALEMPKCHGYSLTNHLSYDYASQPETTKIDPDQLSISSTNNHEASVANNQAELHMNHDQQSFTEAEQKHCDAIDPADTSQWVVTKPGSLEERSEPNDWLTRDSINSIIKAENATHHEEAINLQSNCNSYEESTT